MAAPVINRYYSSIYTTDQTTALKVAGTGFVLGASAYMFLKAVTIAPSAALLAGAYMLDTARTYVPSVFGPSAAAQADAARSLATRVADTFYSILSTGPSAAEQAAAARDFATKVAVGIGTAVIGGGLAAYACLRGRGSDVDSQDIDSLRARYRQEAHIRLEKSLAEIETPEGYQPGDGFNLLHAKQMEQIRNATPIGSDEEDEELLIPAPYWEKGRWAFLPCPHWEKGHYALYPEQIAAGWTVEKCLQALRKAKLHPMSDAEDGG